MPIPAAEYPVPAHFNEAPSPRGDVGITGELHTAVVPHRRGSPARNGLPRAVKRCPYCRSWLARAKARLVCGTCRHCLVRGLATASLVLRACLPAVRAIIVPVQGILGRHAITSAGHAHLSGPFRRRPRNERFRPRCTCHVQDVACAVAPA